MIKQTTLDGIMQALLLRLDSIPTGIVEFKCVRPGLSTKCRHDGVPLLNVY
jgi:hypothetical protein